MVHKPFLFKKKGLAVTNFATIYLISAQKKCHWSFFCSSTVDEMWLVGEFRITVLCQQHLSAHTHVHTTQHIQRTLTPHTNAILEAFLNSYS